MPSPDAAGAAEAADAAHNADAGAAREPQWTAEYALDADTARALIATQFPALAHATVEPFANGWDNTGFLVDETFVFRFPRRSIAAPLIAREIAVVPLVAPHVPAPIPVPRFAGHPANGYPWRFAGYARLGGRPLSETELTPTADLARSLGRFLRALHVLDPAPALAAGLPDDELARLAVAKRAPQAEQRLRALANAGHLDDPEPLIALLHAPLASAGVRRRIVHGDLYARHVLVDDTGTLTGIIDWGDVHFGDPALDLAIAELLFDESGRRILYDAYGTVDGGTRARARWRAVYHSAMTGDYAHHTGESALLRWSLRPLHAIRRELTARS